MEQIFAPHPILHGRVLRVPPEVDVAQPYVRIGVERPDDCRALRVVGKAGRRGEQQIDVPRGIGEGGRFDGARLSGVCGTQINYYYTDSIPIMIYLAFSRTMPLVQDVS